MRPNLTPKDACKRDVTEAGLIEDNTTNRAAWRNTIISYRQHQMVRWGKPEKKEKDPPLTNIFQHIYRTRNAPTRRRESF